MMIVEKMPKDNELSCQKASHYLTNEMNENTNVIFQNK